MGMRDEVRPFAFGNFQVPCNLVKLFKKIHLGNDPLAISPFAKMQMT